MFHCLYLFSVCSPYIPGQVVIATEKGGLYIYDARLAVMVIRDSGTTPHLCLFGPHPRYLLWVERGQLYSADLRTAKVWSADHCSADIIV